MDRTVREVFESNSDNTNMWQSDFVYEANTIQGQTFYKIKKDRYHGNTDKIFDTKEFLELYGTHSMSTKMKEKFNEWMKENHSEYLV